MILFFFLLVSIFAIIFICNRFVKIKCSHQLPNIFNLDNRNYDILVIGDIFWFDYDFEKKKVLSIAAPGRTFYASVLILERLHSLLKEGQGRVIFVIKKKNLIKRRISVFDLPFLHEVTLRNLGINKKKRLKYPFLYEPLNSLKWVGSSKKMSMIEKTTYNMEIDAFCKERNIKYELLITN